MLKSRMVRFAALLGVVAAMAGLIGAAVIGTGAYFTDSHGGQITGNNGTVAINVWGSGATRVGPSTNVAFDFSGILPGAPGKTATVNVTNTGTGPEDLYLAFNNDNDMWSAVNDLGQYGKFTIAGHIYDNLNNKTGATTTGVAGSPTGSYISTTPGTECYNVPRVPTNYLPHVISLGTLAAGTSWSFTINFQYISCMTEHQGESLFNAAGWDLGGTPPAAGTPLLFDIAAFQPGIDPTDAGNGAGQISPLTLPISQDLRATKGTEQ